MISTKIELLERTRAMWRTALPLLDGDRFKDGQLQDVLRSNIYEHVSTLVSPEDDLGDLAIWAFNQAIHRLAKAESYSQGIPFYIEGVSFDLFDEMMRMNLSDESWIEKMVIWDNTPDYPHNLN